MSGDAETTVLAGGCSWIMQQLLRHPNGVISTRVGWSGGEGHNPTEENPGGHAEAVEVVFDPERLSYRQLLEYFFQVHRADLGEDLVGSIYRSEIFYTSEEQRQVAEETIRDVDASGHWLGKTVTKISEAGRFWEEGAEHQDYFLRYPDYPDGSKPPFPRHGVGADREPRPSQHPYSHTLTLGQWRHHPNAVASALRDLRAPRSFCQGACSGRSTRASSARLQTTASPGEAGRGGAPARPGGSPSIRAAARR